MSRATCMVALRTLALAAVLWGGRSDRALARGEEHFGNDPVPARPGLREDVRAVANLASRVYWRDINGSALFAYRGDVGALNETLRRFAEVEGRVREVVLWPGRADLKSFEDKPVVCQWTLEVPGGVAQGLLDMAETEEAAAAFGKAPRLTVYIDGPIGLDRIDPPDSLSLVELADLKDRYVAALEGNRPPAADAKDEKAGRRRVARATARAQAAYQLGQLRPIADQVVAPLIRALGDPEEYVQISAASALKNLGTAARPALGELGKARRGGSDRVEREFREARNAIEASKDHPGREHRAEIERIHQFRATRSGRKP